MLTPVTLQARGVSLCAGLLAISLCGVTLLSPTMTRAQACVGDCNGDGEVTVNELIGMVNIALGNAELSTCMAGDANGDGDITVNEIVSGVNNALNGCPATGPAVCGNGKTDTGEECDDGGICIGGSNAGTPCTSETACDGQGVCIDGPKANWACGSTADCPSSTCVHCRPFGGDACAGNCTREAEAVINLKPGELTEDETGIIPLTTGFIVHGDILSIPLPFPAGGVQVLAIGKERDGKIPAVLKSAGSNLPRVPVTTLACTCLRGLELKTCGGTLNEIDGTPSTDCTPDYTSGNPCSGKKPCTFVFGPGNGGIGTVGCTALDGANMSATQDAGGLAGTPGAGPALVTQSGTGGAGSAVLQTATALGFVIGACTGSGDNYGIDGEFCTADDSQASRGIVLPATLVTGMATAQVNRANGDEGLQIGPYDSSGAPFTCSAISAGDTSGGALAGAFTNLDAETIGDIVVTTSFAAQ